MARQPEAITAAERTDDERSERAGRVLSVVRNLARELHPRRRHAAAGGLDDNLDREFGLDSLGRAELSLRIERAFRVRLPETLFAAAETPRDFLLAVERAVDRAMEKEGVAGHIPDTATVLPAVPVLDTEPSAALTLTEVLDWHVREHPDRPHILLTGSDGDETTITYAALAEAAREVAAGLWDVGVLPGDRVAIMLPTGAAFFQAFFGILHAGAVPAPIYPPIRLSLIEDHLRRQATILTNAGASLLITTEEAVPVARLVRTHVITLKEVATVDGLRGRGTTAMAAAIDGPPASTADTALIQYTSGSTGDPKGVVLSHANLLANIRAMGEVMEASSADVFVSWLPLYHDMGLIGAWLGSLYFGVPAAIMSPYAFLSRPERWLWAIHRYGGTLSAAPNFAFELCVSRIDDADIEGLDLGSLRMVANGAEAVRPHTIARFTERFAKYGFRPEAMSPMYGLAEDCVGLALPPPGRGPIIDRVDRRDLTANGIATPADAEDAHAAEFVACGRPLPGHEIRLVDETGHEAGERRIGRLQFKGPSATAGYFRNPEKTKALFDGEWLDSGDLAYFAKGELFVTGRIKDIILHAGRNIYPEEVEEAVGDIEGIRKGCVVLFGVEDPVLHTERIVLLAETRAAAEDERAALTRKVEEVATEFLQMPPDEVVLARPRTIPKTSSGKLRRAACREIYEHGMRAPRRTVRWQVLRLALSAVAPQIRRVLRAAGGYAYAVYWRIAYALIGMVTFPLVVMLPRRKWRWAVMHAMARAAFPLMRIRFRVTGEPSVPAQGVVIAANHSSYIDSLALIAAIPGELAFVAKKELTGGPVSGPFLKRLGTVFVERIDPGEAMEGARETLDAAKRGERLAFYPEGTFTRMPGLLDFRMGAFLVAAQSTLPVVPVTIRGSRSILRGDDWFARRGAIEVHVSPPISPDGTDFAAAMRLRNAVRAEILLQSGEPDLSHERVVMPGGD